MADHPGAPGDGPEVARWRETRRLLGRNRSRLARLAAGLYPGLPRVAGTDLLSREDWLPAAPMPLEGAPLGWVEDPSPPAVDPAGALTAAVRPPRGPGERYPTYAEAVAALDAPALFENRLCYRLLDARLTGQAGLSFGRARYFDAVSAGHAAAHELAAACGPSGSATMDDLPLRAAVGDPRDVGRRCAVPAVITLTLRRGARGSASFVLHWRDPAKVGHAGGSYQVMPAGVFQPVSECPESERADLSLWRCMVREFSEEFLGDSEDHGAGTGPLDYGRWDFCQRLEAARAEGALGVWCLGAGVDPLTFATDILTVAVFDSDIFDAAFADMVGRNDEGVVVVVGGTPRLGFTQDVVARVSGGGQIQTSGAALLRLAWRHRRALLG